MFLVTFLYYSVMFMKNFNLVILSLLLSLCGFINTANAAVGLDSIAAVVNSGVITQSQLATQTKIVAAQLEAAHQPVPSPSALRQQVLKNLIDKEIQMQIAKKMGIQVDDTAVNDAIKHIAEQNGLTAADFKSKVEQQGLNYNNYRKEIHDEILLSQVQQKAVAPQIKISDQEVTDFLTNHRQELFASTQSGPIAYQLQTIIIPLPDSPTPEQITAAQQAATQALAQLRAGDSFDQVVTSKLGIQFNLQQNDLGLRKADQLPDLYSAVIKNLRPGSISNPIRAPNGFHLLKLIAVHGEDNNPLQNMTETHVRHILIKTTPVQTDSQTKVRLERLRASIQGGLDFATAARSNSEDPGSVAKGGDLGWVTTGVLDPTFESVMEKTRPGQISEPFKSQFGWHILQVLDRRPIQEKANVERQRARELIFQRKFADELQRWLQNMRNIEYVKIFDQG